MEGRLPRERFSGPGCWVWASRPLCRLHSIPQLTWRFHRHQLISSLLTAASEGGQARTEALLAHEDPEASKAMQPGHGPPQAEFTAPSRTPLPPAPATGGIHCPLSQ